MSQHKVLLSQHQLIAVECSPDYKMSNNGAQWCPQSCPNFCKASAAMSSPLEVLFVAKLSRLRQE